MGWIFHCVEVIQVAEKLVEAVHCWQKFVFVAQVILSNWPVAYPMPLSAVAIVTACAGMPIAAPA